MTAEIVIDQTRGSHDSGKLTSASDSAPPKTFVKFYGILVNLFIRVDLFIQGTHNTWEWRPASESAPPETFVKFYGILVNSFMPVILFI